MEVVNTLDIDGTQWELQDAEARNKIAELETQLKQLQEETKEKEITNAVLNPDLKFSGHIIQKGKLVTVSGIIRSTKIVTDVFIENLPKNVTKGLYRITLNWMSDEGEPLGNAVLIFDEGATELINGWNQQTVDIAIAELNMSYFTE